VDLEICRAIRKLDFTGDPADEIIAATSLVHAKQCMKRTLNFHKFEVLSFDCYGTLIDWEEGILKALSPVLSAHGVELPDYEILEHYARIESEIEGGSFIRYREVLREVVREMGRRFGFIPSSSEVNCLVDSLRDWQPFPDTVEALQEFKKRYRLAIISNIDDDLLELSLRHLKVEFDWTITAEQVRSYKPSLNNFRAAIKRIGVPPERILHIAQSLYHDIVPARRVGLSTVWVNRRKGKQGTGATPPASGKPDMEVLDLRELLKVILSARSF